MPDEWIPDKGWADRYFASVEDIIRRVAGRIVEVSPTDLAQDQAGRDYVLTCGGVAARLRKPGCEFRDITIRSRRQSGAKTELEKLRQGASKWMLYGWTDETTVPEWIVLNLGVLFERGLDQDRRETLNKDGGSAFISIPMAEIIATPRLVVDIELKWPTRVSKRGSVWPVVPCPQCRNPAYMEGPAGMPQRRCWECDHVWTPEVA